MKQSDVLRRHLMNDLDSINTIRSEENTDYYAIGDVHGCMEEYAILVSALRFRSNMNARKSVVIQLGDMIDRGPKTVEAILNDKADVKIMGNHELNFVAEWYGQKKCRSSARQLNHDALMQKCPAVQDKVVQSLASRLSHVVVEFPHETFVLSHAPIKDVENHFSFTRRHADAEMSKFCMRSTPVDVERAQHAYDAPTTFVYGHQSWDYTDIAEQKRAQAKNNVKFFNIDSGLVYGDELIALCLNDGYVVRKKANMAYCERQKKM